MSVSFFKKRKKCLDQFNFLYSKYGYLPDDLSSKNVYALLCVPFAIDLKLLSTVFLKCRRAVKVWKHFSSILSKFSNCPFSISVVSILYPLSDTQPSSSSLLHFLIATCLYWIWHALNLATFRNSCRISEKIVDLIVKDIKFCIRCAARHTVRNFWSHNSILCSVDENDNITFLI